MHGWKNHLMSIRDSKCRCVSSGKDAIPVKQKEKHNLPSTLTSMSSTLPATLLTVKKDVLPTAADDNDGPLTRI